MSLEKFLSQLFNIDYSRYSNEIMLHPPGKYFVGGYAPYSFYANDEGWLYLTLMNNHYSASTVHQQKGKVS